MVEGRVGSSGCVTFQLQWLSVSIWPRGSPVQGREAEARAWATEQRGCLQLQRGEISLMISPH